MAAGFWEEMGALRGGMDAPSSCFLQEATRLKETKHENSLNQLFKKYKLTIDMPVRFLDLGIDREHPALKPRDFLTMLSEENKLDLLFSGHSGRDYLEFWEQWRLVQEDHPVFKIHKKELAKCIPIWVFADEGTSQKKKALMILEYQPIIGRGSSRAGDLNMVGVSTTTRFLYSVLSGKCYSGKKKDQAPLHRLVHHFAEDIADCFHHPVPVKGISWTKKIFLVCLGLKGDLQGLVKLGRLTRNFMRDTASGDGPGICHLRKAGQAGHPWHIIDFQAMQKMKANLPDPWASPPSLISIIPQSDTHKAAFFRLDIFHLLLKGVFADMSANAIATWN